MKNFVQEGDRLSIAKGSLVGPNNPVLSGDPVVCGRIVGVAVANAVPAASGPADDGNVIVQLKGVFNLSVSSVHNGLSLGETVYIDPSTGALSDDFADVPFGVALGTVNSGSTASIDVKVFGLSPSATGANS